MLINLPPPPPPPPPPACEIIIDDADHRDLNAPDDRLTYFWGGRWIDANGDAWGWSIAEDSAIYDTPACAGVTTRQIMRPGTSRHINRN